MSKYRMGDTECPLMEMLIWKLKQLLAQDIIERIWGVCVCACVCVYLFVHSTNTKKARSTCSTLMNQHGNKTLSFCLSKSAF